MYKSDTEIASEFNGLEVVKIEKGRDSGYITCEAPQAGDHVAGGSDSFTDHYIMYDNGTIAFDNWYPESVYNALVRAICEAPEGITTTECNHVYTVRADSRIKKCKVCGHVENEGARL